MSDDAAYIIKVIKFLKNISTNLQHVTYIFHMIYWVCDHIRNINQKTDHMISHFKQTFIKKNQKGLMKVLWMVFQNFLL